MGAQDDKSYLTSIAIGFSIAITVIAVSLRLLARKLHKIPIGADDYAIIVGAVDLQPLERTKDSLLMFAGFYHRRLHRFHFQSVITPTTSTAAH